MPTDSDSDSDLTQPKPQQLPWDVDRLRWIAFLLTATRPPSLSWHTWRAWLAGKRLPRLSSIPAIVAAIGTPDAAFLRAMGWENISGATSVGIAVALMQANKTKLQNKARAASQAAAGDRSTERVQRHRARAEYALYAQQIGLPLPLNKKGHVDLRKVSPPPKPPAYIDQDDIVIP